MNGKNLYLQCQQVVCALDLFAAADLVCQQLIASHQARVKAVKLQFACCTSTGHPQRIAA